MTIVTTAFQATAYQRNGFQIATEVLAGAGGVLPAWMRALLLAQVKRKKPKPEPVPEPEVAQVELRLRVIPPTLAMPARASLAALRDAARAAAARLVADAAELDELIAAMEEAA